MKKILLFLSMMITVITFSYTRSEGIYSKEIFENNRYYIMNVIMKNDKILSISFDIKNKNGRSIIFGNKDKMHQKKEIEKILYSGMDIEKIFILDKKTTKIIKEMYYELIQDKTVIE